MKHLLGLEEIDFELLAYAYNRLPDPDMHYYKGGNLSYIIPVYKPEPISIAGYCAAEAHPMEYIEFWFDLKRTDYGALKWEPRKKVYIDNGGINGYSDN